MKLLLTSAGISNSDIQNALVDLLGKPIEESKALFIPTAIYGVINGGEIVRKVICGKLGDPFCELGWKSLGLLELTALPTIKKELWMDKLMEADALLVGGGDCQYLCYWMIKSGISDMLPELLEKIVYVGLSAGSMIMTQYGTTLGNHTLPPETVKSFGFVNFAIHPHLNYPEFPLNSLENLEKLAKTIAVPSYLIDDNTAIKVNNGNIDVISKGEWKLMPSS